jgi:hypothetical protein
VKSIEVEPMSFWEARRLINALNYSISSEALICGVFTIFDTVRFFQ